MFSGLLPILAKIVTAICGAFNFAILLTQLNPSNLVQLSVVQGLTFLFVSSLDQYYSGKFVAAIKSGKNKYSAIASVNLVRRRWILVIACSITFYLGFYVESVDGFDLAAVFFYSASWIYAIDWALPYLVSRKYWLLKITISAVAVSLLLYFLNMVQVLRASTILFVYGVANYLPAFLIRGHYLKINEAPALVLGKDIAKKNAPLVLLSALGSLFYNAPLFFITLPKFAPLNYQYVVLWRVVGFVIQFIPPVVDNGIAESVQNKNLSKFIIKYYIIIALFSLLILMPLKYLKDQINFGDYSNIVSIVVDNEWVFKVFIVAYALEYASTRLFHIYRDLVNFKIIGILTIIFFSMWALIYYLPGSFIEPGMLIIPAIIMQFIITLAFLYSILHAKQDI